LSEVRGEIAKKELGLKVLGDSFELMPNALVIHGKPTIQQYDEAFRRLAIIESASSWWLNPDGNKFAAVFWEAMKE